MNYVQQLRKITPEVKFHNSTRFNLEKVVEETIEAQEEINLQRRPELLIELIDVVTASANALYKAGYPDNQINLAFETVYKKNKSRGYYK